jgi:hypothetical protein
MTEVNSLDYWNTRFATDWTQRRGREQSSFFARVALELMPDWLVRVLRDGATVCDWGCAMGDGTAALAHALDGARFTGIDFAPAAIARASRDHPGLPFACRDLLREAPGDRFDVLFSSNVLEHFRAPFQVLAQLATHTGRLMVHLVPFREPRSAREPEHHVAFDWNDLALAPLPGWWLVHAAVADTRQRADSRWGGEQVLLVHARDEEIAGLDLSLADIRIDTPANESLATARADGARRELMARVDALVQARTAEADAAIRSLLTQVESLTAANKAMVEGPLRAQAEQIARLDGELLRLLTQIESLTAANKAMVEGPLRAQAEQVARLDGELRATRQDTEALRRSRSWRWTAPLRRLLGGNG